MTADFYYTQDAAARALAAAIADIRADWDISVATLPDYKVDLLNLAARPDATAALARFPDHHLAAFELHSHGDFARWGDRDAGKASQTRCFAFLTK